MTLAGSGIGVTVNDGPPPDSNLEYAATSLAAESGSALDRESVMNAILSAFADRYPLLGTPALSAAASNPSISRCPMAHRVPCTSFVRISLSEAMALRRKSSP